MPRLFHYLIAATLLLFSATLPASDETGNKVRAIPLELTASYMNNAELQAGTQVQFLVSLGDDAYLYMFMVMPDGSVNKILPDPKQADHFYRVGYFQTIPEYDDSSFRFVYSREMNNTEVFVFASDKKIIVDPPYADINAVRTSILSSSSAFGHSSMRLSI